MAVDCLHAGFQYSVTSGKLFSLIQIGILIVWQVWSDQRYFRAKEATAGCVLLVLCGMHYLVRAFLGIRESLVIKAAAMTDA